MIIVGNTSLRSKILMLSVNKREVFSMNTKLMGCNFSYAIIELSAIHSHARVFKVNLRNCDKSKKKGSKSIEY